MSTSTTENYEKLLAAAELSESERHSLLSAARRRIVCDVLANEGASITFEKLAEAVAAREREESKPATEDEVRIALHHIHLPKLASAGVIDYDAETKQIETDHASLGQLTG